VEVIRSSVTKDLKGPESQFRDIWLSHSPPLQRHRDAYWQLPQLRRSVATALKTYDIATLGHATYLYAQCLGSEEYQWSYSWTAIDFLNRGLHKFVPEANPLERERQLAQGNRRTKGMTADEIFNYSRTQEPDPGLKMLFGGET
jgi:hypothetical protein